MDLGENMFCLNNHAMRDQIGNNAAAAAWSSSSWEPYSNPTLLINAFHTTSTAPDTSSFTHRHHPPLFPDPHLTCLKLGKRHYLEDTSCSSSSSAAAAAVPPPGSRHVSVAAGVGGGVARCQVEGCHVALVNSKEYHRRHKVCEMHSKAPKVVVLGREQRFCQQCSRFHVVSEFDDTKRSCRRRLAGHNQRRRKTTSLHHHSPTNISTQAGCALSLLSPPGSGSDSWLSHADLSIRCSAALHELIAENRAALMTRQQLVLDRDCHLHQNAQVQLDSKEIHQPDPNYFPHQNN